MTDFTIVRTDEAALPDAQMGVVRQFLTRCYQGLSREDNRRWHKLWKKIRALEAGEMVRVSFTFHRHLPSHRGYMKLETAVFDAQERFAERDNFRDWLKIGAKYVLWAPGPTGGIVPLPKSISFAAADEEEFIRYVRGALDFMRSPHFGKWLWPHLSEAERYAMIDPILDEYDQFLQRFA